MDNYPQPVDQPFISVILLDVRILTILDYSINTTRSMNATRFYNIPSTQGEQPIDLDGTRDCKNDEHRPNSYE